KNRENRTNLIESVRMGLLRFFGNRRDCSVTDGVFSNEIALLLGKFEYSAQGAFDMLQCAPAERFRRSNVIEPPLNVIRAHFLHPNRSAAGFQMASPNVPVSLQRRWPLVLFNAGKIDSLDKIPQLDHLFRRAAWAVYSS